MDRKEFSRRKKLMEEKVKLKLIEKYPHIHELYQSGEITLKQAYDGAQSEMLGIQTFKSKGTKSFITHSTRIEKEETENTIKSEDNKDSSFFFNTPQTEPQLYDKIKSELTRETLPFGRNPIGDNPKYNITYDEVNKMGYGEFKDFILSVRKELLNLWEEQNIPPYIGKDKKGIVDDIENLIQFDVERLWKKGDDIYEYILSNDFHHGSSCNQFQPSLHKTRAGDVSMWDVIKEPSLELKFIRTFTRNLKQDKMYMFSKMMENKTTTPTLLAFMEQFEPGWA